MKRFARDPMTLLIACNAWLQRVLHPPTDPQYPDHNFDQLAEALQLWCSTCGLDGALALSDAALFYYRPRARKGRLRALVRAEGLIQLMKNRAVQPRRRRRARATGVPRLVDSIEAAKMLDISPRTLATLTDEGTVPCLYLGRSKRYDVETLSEIVKNGQRKRRQNSVGRA
jgi:hypothetical protein